MERRHVGALERHAQTVTVLLTVGLLAWVAHTTHETDKAVTSLTERIDGLLRQQRFVTDSLLARIKTVEDRWSTLSSRIRDCEARVIRAEAECADADHTHNSQTGGIQRVD